MPLVRKRPLAVAVTFAARPGTLETLEGSVGYGTHDALVTGAAGEQWPISRSTFDATYLPLEGQRHGVAGRYAKRPVIVRADQMSRPFSVTTKGGAVLSGAAGDWRLRYGDGHEGIVAASIFKATYEVLSGDDVSARTPDSQD